MSENEIIKKMSEVDEQEVGEVLELCDADGCENEAIPNQDLCGGCQQYVNDEEDEDNRNRAWIEARI